MAAITRLVSYRYLLFIMAVVVFWALVFLDTLTRMVGMWESSNTYTHCFVVAPVCLYLVWINRAEFMRYQPTLFYPALLATVMALLLWVVARLGKVDAVEYIATVAILVCSVSTFLGRDVLRVLAFPLLFLFFLVPIGDELVPTLQVITAKAAVALLGLTNIPVFFEGLFISIPAGKFVVAEACSGIRFLISTIFLGFVCASLFFNAYPKRILFILFAIVLPVVANILRVFGIILIGHFIDMKYAAGADHLVYGWFFFLLITVVMILIGLYLRDDKDPAVPELPGESAVVDAQWFGWPQSTWSMPLLAAIVLGSVAAQQFPNRDFYLPEQVFAEAGPVGLVGSGSAFINKEVDTFDRRSMTFREQTGTYAVQMEAFSGAGERSELISWHNRLYDPDIWSERSRNQHLVEHNGETFNVVVLDLIARGGGQKSLLYWYRVPGYSGDNRVLVKVLQTLNVLIGRGRYGVLVQLTVDPSINSLQPVDQPALLTDWLDQHYAELDEIFLFD